MGRIMRSFLFLFIALISINCQGAYVEVPAGMVITFAGAVCPSGYMATEGQSLQRSKYPKLFSAIGTTHGTLSGTHFNIPDYRGRFLRMVDGSSGRDPDAGSRGAMNAGGTTGAGIGSVQSDEFGSHSHTLGGSYVSAAAGSGNSVLFQVGNIASGGAGGNETRPKNAYVNYCIKL
jgi:microcystin-dependent protein